jgi:histone-lysine N-methyltransferase EZH2
MSFFDEDSDSSIEILEVRRVINVDDDEEEDHLNVAGAVVETIEILDDSSDESEEEEEHMNAPVAVAAEDNIQTDDSDDSEEEKEHANQEAVAMETIQKDDSDGGNGDSNVDHPLAHLDEIDLLDGFEDEFHDSFSLEVDDIGTNFAMATHTVTNLEGQSPSEAASDEDSDDGDDGDDGEQEDQEKTKSLWLDDTSRRKFVKDLNRQVNRDRRELTNTRIARLDELLDEARQNKIPSRRPGILVKLRRTYDRNVKTKQEGRTFISFNSNHKGNWSLSHSFVRLDSTPVSVLEDQMPKNVARVLLDAPFANLKHLEGEEGNLDFMNSRFFQENKTDEEIAEFRSLFNIKPREIEILRGPCYKREEADEIVKRALVFYKASKFRNANLDQLTEIMMEIFPSPAYYEPDLRLKVQKYFDDPTSLSEAVFAAPRPDITCEPPVETTHPTLEGDDPGYLNAVDTYRNLFCSRCQMFICNLHPEYEPGSLQIQYESAISEERARGSRRILRHLPSPQYRDKWIPTRKTLSSFDKAVCRRLFLIYEGDLKKVALFLNVAEYLVEEFCSDFKLPKWKMFIKKPIVGPKKIQQWYSTRCYPVKLYNAHSQTAGHERVSFFPCFHEGPCENPDSECTCVQNRHFCTLHCARGRNSRNFFRGCSCKGPCTTMCTCYAARRECDPLLCACTGCKDTAGKPRTTQRCQNDNITMRRRMLTYIGISEIPGAGFGLFSRYRIPKDAYIDEYIGEIISHDEAQRRGIIYDSEKNTSLFHINEDLWIDASNMCNHMRFINHSNTPNIKTRIVSIRGESRIGFFAAKEIPPQTEMTLNYDFQDGKNVVDGVPGFLNQDGEKRGGVQMKSKRKGNPKKRKRPAP